MAKYSVHKQGHSIVRYLYTILLYLALPFILLRLIWRSRRLPAYRKRLAERFGFFPIQLQQCIWVHAVSVGETLAALPLIKALQAKHPELPILVTTMTPTGSARVRAALGDSVSHVYLPYDLPDAIARFLRSMNPCKAILMETELWPNWLAACHANNIPIYLLNARLSPRSARRYQFAGKTARQMLQHVSLIAASAQADAQRFIALGAAPQKVSVVGNIKFDLVVPDALAEQSLILREQLGKQRFVWIAASTHEVEEEQVLAAHRLLRVQVADALLILVPRHPDRFEQVARLCAREGVVARRSVGEHSNPASIYLADTMGELLLLYGAADVVFVGGSLIPRGGHNILEPAALAKPVLTGPHLFNFADIQRLFMQQQALTVVEDATGLANVLVALSHDAAAREVLGQHAHQVVESNRGALKRQMDLLMQEV